MTTSINTTDSVLIVNGKVIDTGIAQNLQAQVNPARAESTLGAIATGQTGGTGTSPAQGSAAGGDNFSLGRVNTSSGDVIPMMFPTGDMGAGQMEVICAPGTAVTFKFVVPAEARAHPGKLGFIKTFAVPGKDDAKIAVTIGQGQAAPTADNAVPAGTTDYFKVDQPEEAGICNFAVGPTYDMKILSVNGSFAIQVQLPQG